MVGSQLPQKTRAITHPSWVGPIALVPPAPRLSCVVPAPPCVARHAYRVEALLGATVLKRHAPLGAAALSAAGANGARD